MKILWIVNIIFPYPAKKLGMQENAFGGWLTGLLDGVLKCDDMEIAIATVYKGKDIKEFYDGKIRYYLLPGAPTTKYNKILEKYWKEINDRFKPDLVHIHGTEMTQGLAFQNACANAKSIVSIQGLVGEIGKVYYGGIPVKEIAKNITFRDIIKNDNIIQQKCRFIQRGENEKKSIKKAMAIIGRTTWDYANVKAINPNVLYYKANETLRSDFYNHVWNIKEMSKYTIFTSQASYPIKGLHFLLEAVAILKEKYQNVKLYVAGENITNRGIKLSGYGKYIQKLIKKYGLENNIEFTGILNSNQIVQRVLDTNVFVLPSAIENSSNSLGEAMLLGVPCVASNNGGTMDILEHKKEGFLYPYTEPAMLAEYIARYFENDDLCLKYGENARKKALETHDRTKNVEELIKIYKGVLEKNEKD